MHKSLGNVENKAKGQKDKPQSKATQDKKREHQRQVLMKRLLSSGKLASGEERLKYTIKNDAAEDKDGVLNV